MGRVVALAQQSSLLLALDFTLDPRLRLIGAFVWALLFLGAALALRQRRPFARQVIPLLFLLYAPYELSLLLFTPVPLARRGGLFNAVFYIVVVAFSYWTLNRSAVQSYFVKGRSETNG